MASTFNRLLRFRTAFINAADTTPDAFAFVDQTAVAQSTALISNSITVSGINAAAVISVVGGRYSVNGGAFTNSTTSVVNGNTVRAENTSSGSALTATNTTVTIGGVSDTFTVTTASGTQSVLAASALSFDGWHKFDTSGGMGSGGNAPVSLAIRYVGGNTRLFTWISYLGQNGVTEYQVDAAPAGTIGGATALTFVRYWGDIRNGHVSVDGGASPETDRTITGGLWWDQARNGLWWSYGSNYVPLVGHPTLGFTHLNDTDGSFTSYGPWRSNIDSPRFMGGACASIPTGYASAFGNADYVQMGVVYSGAAGCPQGANLHAVTLPNPYTEPPNYVTVDSNIGFTQKTVIRHDYTHPQYRTDLTYAYCSWGDPLAPPPGKYDARLGSITITDGTHAWGGCDISADAASASVDAMTNVFFINSATKRGVLYFGQQMCTPSGFTPVGDDKIHYGYAEYNHATDTGSTAAGYQDNYCAHQQIMAFESWHSTGPFCGYTAARAWIYDPDLLVNAAAFGGPTGVTAFTPTHAEVDLGPQVSALSFPIATTINSEGSQASGNIGGGVLDNVNKKIYLPVKIDTVTVPGTQRYAIAVIAVAY